MTRTKNAPQSRTPSSYSAKKKQRQRAFLHSSVHRRLSEAEQAAADDAAAAARARHDTSVASTALNDVSTLSQRSILGTRRASTGGGFSSLAARRRSLELEEKR